MDDKLQTISCDRHSETLCAVVCRHLVNSNGHPLGFVENSSEPDDLQGWCYACEYFFQQQDEMTEEFKRFCDIAVVCINCYADIKAKHSLSALFGANA